MMKAALTLTVLLLAWAPYLAGQNLPEPNRELENAAIAANTPDARDTLRHLFRLAREGQGTALLEQVRDIAIGAAHSDPERDYVLYSLAAALGDFQPGAVDPKVLEYLGQTRSLVRVPHEENPNMGVPLYNIRAAAAGSLAEWKRQKQESAAPGVAYTDVESFMTSLGVLDGPALTAHVRKSRDLFEPAEREAVVLAAPGLIDAPKASVVMAELAPDLLGRPAVDDALFELLGHRELGAAAALVLGRSGDAAILDRLAVSAGGEDSLESRRASLAIDVFLSADAR